MRSFLIFFLILYLAIGFAQPKREVRSVWITTNHQLDWPPKTFDPEIQKKFLIEILDNLKSKKFNTIFFQVRSQGTVLYKSDFEPFSQFLTGRLGVNPSYDPLEFLIQEAHKRNIEVHAWLNMVNIKSGDTPLPITDPPHIAIAHPEWVRKYNENNNVSYWLDVGFPEVRDYLKNICVEIVARYDIDGIHLDYVRYPGIDFDDSLSFHIYGKKKSKDEFRKENINLLVASIYDTLISMKPKLKIGSAPIGIYENIESAQGFQGKHSVYQDAREWLRRKKQDYLVPQIYWDTKSNPKFEVLVDDWTRNNFGRQIIIGIGAFNSSVLNEIETQIDIARKYKSAGQSFFRYENIKNIDFKAYQFPANIPPMNWKDSIPPEPPNILVGRNLPGKLGMVELVWGIPDKAKDGDTAKYYNIYRSLSATIDRENPAFILNTTRNYYYYDFITKPSQLEYYYQVSSFDNANNESLSATEIVKVELLNLKEILKPAYPKDLVAFRVEGREGNLIIESNKNTYVRISLFNSAGKEILSIPQTQLKTGLNYFNIELPTNWGKNFTIKIFFKDRTEVIKFKV